MFATIEAMADANPIRLSAGSDAYLAAKTPSCNLLHIAYLFFLNRRENSPKKGRKTTYRTGHSLK
jgi:hypothetical protein